MKKIILLTDYNSHFGSRWDSVPYNSGFDKELIVDFFAKEGYKVEYIPFASAKNLENVENVHVLYTSSEDVGYHYKDYIEDIIYYLELKGAKVIPLYKYLKANNNKVFMELIRQEIFREFNCLKSWTFGAFEEMENIIDELSFPIVIKTATGAMSRGVALAKNKKELVEKAKKISRTRDIYQDVKDKLRPFKHKGYRTKSLYRKKFILQEFVPNLKNDWKVLIFGDKYFIFSRPVRESDFRASGSGAVNYLFGSECIFPKGIFDFAKNIFDKINVPHLSIDIAYDGDKFYLIEFQAIYFGTVGVVKSDVYFEKQDGTWKAIKKNESLEWFYVNSIVNYIENRVATNNLLKV